MCLKSSTGDESGSNVRIPGKRKGGRKVGVGLKGELNISLNFSFIDLFGRCQYLHFLDWIYKFVQLNGI